MARSGLRRYKNATRAPNNWRIDGAIGARVLSLGTHSYLRFTSIPANLHRLSMGWNSALFALVPRPNDLEGRAVDVAASRIELLNNAKSGNIFVNKARAICCC